MNDITTSLYSARLVVSGDAPPIEGGALLVQGGQILAVGTRAELERSNGDAERIDFPDAVIAPLLVNAHTHLELTNFPDWAAAAGRNETPDSFVDWIINLIKVKTGLCSDSFRALSQMVSSNRFRPEPERLEISWRTMVPGTSTQERHFTGLFF